MQETIETLNFFLALGGITLALCAVYLLFDLKTSRSLAPLISRYGLIVAFLVTLGTSAMTLLYSEIFGFVPCGLCWLQRVFTYSQVFITGTAIWIKEKYKNALVFSRTNDESEFAVEVARDHDLKNISIINLVEANLPDAWLS